MIKNISRIIVYIGYICLVIGLLFTVYGFNTYLTGPIEKEPIKLECINYYNNIIDPINASLTAISSGCNDNYDYERAFYGIKLAFLGLLLLTATFLFGNPLRKLRYRILHLRCLNEAYVLDKKDDFQAEFILISAGLLCIIIINLQTPNIISRYSNLNFQLSLIMEDFFIRASIFLFFILIFFATQLFVLFFAYHNIDDFLLLRLIKNGKLQFDPKIIELKWTYFKQSRGLRFTYIYTLLVVIYYLVLLWINDPIIHSILGVAALTSILLTPLIFAFIFIYSLARIKACKQLGIPYEKELENEEHRQLKTNFSIYWSYLIFIALVKMTFSYLIMLLQPIFTQSVAYKLPFVQHVATNTLIQIASLVGQIFDYSNGLIFLFPFFIGELYLCELVMNLLWFRNEISKTMRERYQTEFGLFLLAFISTQSLIAIGYGYINIITTMVSLLVSFITFINLRSYRVFAQK